MERGWDATGLLKPLWKRAGLTRDKLAKETGILGGTLSGYNSGRLSLGMANAQRIASALDVTVEDLGAPSSLTGHQPPLEAAALHQLVQTGRVLAKAAEALVSLRDDVEPLLEEQRLLVASMRTLVAELQTLEAARPRGRAAR